MSTRTTIEEILTKFPPPKTYINTTPKCSSMKKQQSKRKPPIRQKKVCHSYEYHKAKTGLPEDSPSGDTSDDDYR